MLEGRPQQHGVEVQPVDDEQLVQAVHRAAQGALGRVPGRGLGVQGVEAGGQDVLGTPDAAGVHPGAR